MVTIPLFYVYDDQEEEEKKQNNFSGKQKQNKSFKHIFV